MNIREELEKRARSVPAQTVFWYDGKACDYRQLKESSFRMAWALFRLGVKQGDRVAIYLPNCPQYVYAYLAIYSLGAIAVPLDFYLGEEEVSSFLRHAEVKVLISTGQARLKLDNLPDRISSLREIVVLEEGRGRFLSWGDLVNDSSGELPPLRFSEDNISSIFYTSGSTGRPKGVVWNCRHLHLGSRAAMDVLRLDESSRGLAAVPFSHSSGVMFPVIALLGGGGFVIMKRFSPLGFVRLIEKHRVTLVWMVPPMFLAVLGLKNLDGFDLSSLRQAAVFGAPSDPGIMRSFKRHCPRGSMFNGWGMTETSPPNTVSEPDRVESVGRVLPPAEIKIFNRAGEELPPGEIGEIVIRGPVVCRGYYRDPELTARAFRNGWFYTGDLGSFDGKGNLSIEGRLKDMIKVGGEIVMAPEVENILLRHPGVTEAAVVGVHDPVRGEVPKAYVVLEEGVELSPGHLVRFCRESLANFKVPRLIEFRKSLPKTGPGKIDKSKLAAVEA